MVLIHYRTNAYTEKFVLCRQGNASAPITVRGVPGPNGELPVLDGNGATTRTNLSYWGENRAVIKIGGASKPSDTMPRYITVENLDIRGARPPFSFTGATGANLNYQNNAAAIWIEKGENITIRNCTLSDSGNGFFVSSTDTILSTNILVERCHIFGNGNTNSLYEHNVYTAARGMTFQFNRLGPLRTGCLGNNLKDRSAGLVVRYNWIEGGNRELDLVDAEDSIQLRTDPAYQTTFVYGNVILEPNADGNKQLIHYGGDSGTTTGYRKGTLHFFNNTVISRRPDQTTLFRFSTNDEQCEARNNIFYTTNTGSSLALVDASGVLNYSHNWLKAGYRNSFSTVLGTVNNNGFNISTEPPGFVNATNDFHLVKGSPCVNAGGTLAAAVLPAHKPAFHYIPHQSSEIRTEDTALDIGAYELPKPIKQWRNSKFGLDANNLSIAGDTVDNDGDGVVNLLEYAFGMEPLVSSDQGFPRSSLMADDAQQFLTLSFTILPPPSGLTYTVQTSDDLVNWEDGTIYSDSTNLLETATTVDISPPDSTNKLVRLSSPIDAPPTRFMRIKVDLEN